MVLGLLREIEKTWYRLLHCLPAATTYCFTLTGKLFQHEYRGAEPAA